MSKMNESDVKNLTTINAAFGRSLVLLNHEWDEEDSGLLQKIMTAKVGDIPELFHEMFTKLLYGASEEFKNMEVGDLLCMFIDGETYDPFEGFDE